MKLKRVHRIILFALVLLVLVGGIAFARAGGAGGGSRSGSGGSSDGLVELVIWLIIMLFQVLGPIPTLIIIVVVIVVAVIVKKVKGKKSAINQLSVKQNAPERISGYSRFKERNPSFSRDTFIEKVKTAFIEIQKAWSSKDLSNVRRFISDGVFQRFNTQFKMMDILQQENPLSDITIENMSIVKFEVDGNYDIIDVAITATMKDKFICRTIPQLNSPGGTETFLEYWSFIRKRGIEEKDIYHTMECPNCSAPLAENMGEIGNCGYCGALVNSGEFDWVLSEITQADDYSRQNMIQKAQNLKKAVAQLQNEYDDFAVQLVEDKASNGYLQVQTAEVLKDPAIIRRFVTDSAFEKLTARFPEERIVYNRLFLNDVTLVAAQKEQDKNILTFSVTVSYQRVKLTKSDKASIIDPYIKSHTEYLQMMRDSAAGKSKGSLYTHSCPACGASIQDSLDINCAYCGSPLNNTSSEWIVSNLLSHEEYKAYLEREKSDLTMKISGDFIDNLYDVKDYAFNNLIIMISADGIFADEERDFIQTFARKWGYKMDRIEPLFNMARAGKLSIRMPQDPGKRKKIYDIMVKAAGIDNTVTDEERQLLEYVKNTYL